MNEKELIKEWYFDNAIIRKPKLKDACDVICDLCVEVKNLRRELEFEKNSNGVKAQEYSVMMIEIQNVIQKYV